MKHILTNLKTFWKSLKAGKQELALRMGISHTIVLKMLHNSGMTKKMSQWMPHNLLRSQKETRMMIAYENLRRCREDPNILGRIVAIDES
jgi:hypothetical protein